MIDLITNLLPDSLRNENFHNRAVWLLEYMTPKPNEPELNEQSFREKLNILRMIRCAIDQLGTIQYKIIQMIRDLDIMPKLNILLKFILSHSRENEYARGLKFEATWLLLVFSSDDDKQTTRFIVDP